MVTDNSSYLFISYVVVYYHDRLKGCFKFPRFYSSCKASTDFFILGLCLLIPRSMLSHTLVHSTFFLAT